MDEKIINEIRAVLSVKSLREKVETILHYKICEIIEDHKKEFEHLDTVITGIEPSPAAAIYNFRLTRINDHWEANPSFIPDEITTYVTANAVPGIISMPVKLTTESAVYRVTFEMESETGIVGEVVTLEDKRAGSTGLIPEQIDTPEFREYLSLLAGDQDLYKHIMSEFRLKWKPVIQKRASTST